MAYLVKAYPSYEGLLEACQASFVGAWVFEVEVYHPFGFVLAFIVILRSQVESIHLNGFHE
jgi:hypothetical protein